MVVDPTEIVAEVSRKMEEKICRSNLALLEQQRLRRLEMAYL